jgi:hypothetical protein
MSSRAHAFKLTKWYFDCAGDDGRTAIGYWASLAWRGLSLTWQSIAVCETGRAPIERWSLAGGAAPTRERDRIVWPATALGCTFAADSCHPVLASRLFENEAGFVDWRCEAPSALVKVECAGRPPMSGTGYAEQLTLTIPPWRLPISDLRWGRWMDETAARSVVWIEWRGAEPRTWVFVDGVLVPQAAVDDCCISAPPARLTLLPSSTLSTRALADTIQRIPGLHALIPSSVLSLRETKWSSLGTLRCPSAPPVEGRAIHERVTFL